MKAPFISGTFFGRTLSKSGFMKSPDTCQIRSSKHGNHDKYSPRFLRFITVQCFGTGLRNIHSLKKNKWQKI